MGPSTASRPGCIAAGVYGARCLASLFGVELRYKTGAFIGASMVGIAYEMMGS